LEKTSKIIKSNRQPSATMGTQTDRLHSKRLAQRGLTLAPYRPVSNRTRPRMVVEMASAAELWAFLACRRAYRHHTL